MKPENSTERTPAARASADPGYLPPAGHGAGDAPARRSPMLTSLSRHLPRPAASAAELDALRRRAWRQDGVLSLRDGDDRLT
jgi:hypothetical protein